MRLERDKALREVQQLKTAMDQVDNGPNDDIDGDDDQDALVEYESPQAVAENVELWRAAEDVDCFKHLIKGQSDLKFTTTPQ